MRILAKPDGSVNRLDRFPMTAAPFDRSWSTATAAVVGAGSLVVRTALAGTGTFRRTFSGSASLTLARPALAGAGTGGSGMPISGIVDTLFLNTEIHQGDVGALFALAIGQSDGTGADLAGGSVEYHFQKPDGAMLVVQAAIGGGGATTYVTVDGDLDQVGTWRYQAFVVLGAVRFYTDVKKFKVKPNLPF